MDGRMNGVMDGWINGWIDIGMNGVMDGWSDKVQKATSFGSMKAPLQLGQMICCHQQL